MTTRPRNPYRLAFAFGTLALILVVAGLSGYQLSRHARFVAGTAWTGAVIWWQVAAGLAALPLAVYFARAANRSQG